MTLSNLSLSPWTLSSCFSLSRSSARLRSKTFNLAFRSSISLLAAVLAAGRGPVVVDEGFRAAGGVVVRDDGPPVSFSSAFVLA